MTHDRIERRTFLTGAGAAAIAASAALDESHAQHMVPNSTGTDAPKLKAPPNACDCHMHIYDPARFPMPPSPRPAPDNATVAEYRLLQKRIGTTRVVVVQPRNAVLDNRVTLDAIKQLAPARGVAVVNRSITDAELKSFNEGGIRGIRFSLDNPATRAVTPDMVEPLAKRVADLGWHVQFNVNSAIILDIEAILRRLPTPMVFDHLAHPGAAGIEDRSHKIVRELIDKGRAWVKLSGAYSNSKVRTSQVSGSDSDCASIREGRARAPSLGQRLAAPGRAEQQARRRPADRPALGMGAGRGNAPSHPGRQPGHAVRISQNNRRNAHGHQAARLAAVAQDTGRLFHRHGLAGPDHRGGGAGARARRLGALRARRTHGLAHPSARPDHPHHRRCGTRTGLGRPDQGGARRRHRVLRAEREALARRRARHWR